MTNLQEIWKPVINFEGIYEVSNYGRVRGLDRPSNQLNKWGSISKCYIKGVALNPRPTNCGYLRVQLTGGTPKTNKWHSVHRLVAIAFISNPNNYSCVGHFDNDKTNNYVDNLSWCTHQQNTDHIVEQNRHTAGIRNGRATINELQVKEIRDLRKAGRTLQSIANDYGFSKTHISWIVNRKSWAHVS